MILVGFSMFGLAVHFARTIDPASVARILGRGALAFVAIVTMTIGGWLAALGTEALLGFPFGDSSGGLVLFAYLGGLALGTMELSLTHGLLRRSADATESMPVELTAHAVFVAGQLALCLTLLMAFICFVVAITMARVEIDHAGWFRRRRMNPSQPRSKPVALHDSDLVLVSRP